MYRTLQSLFLLALITVGLAGCASSPDIAARHEQGHSSVGQNPVENPDERRSRLRAVFERYEGTPYRYGGTNGRGFDCSGFIGQAYEEAFGLLLPRTTSQLLAGGDRVSRDRLQPGDLVFFNIRGKEQHVGIFIGENRFIHASTSVGVTQSSLDGFYWRDRFTQARRFD